MRRRLLVLLAVAAVLAVPSSALAAPVLVLGHDGRVAHRDDPFLGGSAVTPVPATTALPRAHADAVGGVAGGAGGGAGLSGGSPPAPTKPAPPKKTHKPPSVTVGSVLGSLKRSGAITPAQGSQALGAFNAALAAERKLSGTRRTELSAVTQTVHTIAADHELIASRLPAIVATLNANRRWWTTGSLLASGARVEFAGSQLVWEYYPGQGIQLQVLGSFGKADGLYTAGAADYPAMKQLLAEIIPLASRRGGGMTWEYYFTFDGGAPPWTSAMSQATGLEALTRAYEATKNPYYLTIASRAIPVFTHPPPQGVNVATPRGVRFLQYTFAPQTAIINAFLQTLIGLDDYAQVSHNATAARLFAQGNAEAQYEVPRYDTGAWSLYTPGSEDTLSYHELVTGFLTQLCQLTSAPVYCTTAQHFTAYLKTPPALADLTPAARLNRAFALRFRLSKVSRVGIVVARGSQTVFATSASFPYGVGSFSIPKLGGGGYTITLTATDLAGNFTRTPGTLTVG